ncbi:MAG: methionine adenosyltransferase [Oscillospiraceae bacterium]|jgi:S-adenosylmethionine synthetase
MDEITLFSSESVTEGHPDKVCDRVADSILDAILSEDHSSHVACEVTATTDSMHIFGEITSSARVNYEDIARKAIREIGYTEKGHGFDADTCSIKVDIHEQSPDIAMGVNKETLLDSGAGDQGMMFGYACRETDCLMPMPITMAHRLCRYLAQSRKNGSIPYLLPDGKAQVTVKYKNGAPVSLDTVVLSTQHRSTVSIEQLREDMIEKVIKKALPEDLIDSSTKFLVNPTGRFVVGGPAGDSGLTGRKIIVDTYGGSARHGGGAFSGKDPSKVDRSATYMARYLAKNVVASGIADRCEIQLGYAIGVAKPVSVNVETYGTSKVPDAKIARVLSEKVDLRPGAIIENFGLRAPIYTRLSSYGHFGENALDMPLEKTDIADRLREYLNG